MNIMSSSLPPISQSNVSFVNAPIDVDGEIHSNSLNVSKFSKESKEFYNNTIDG